MKNEKTRARAIRSVKRKHFLSWSSLYLSLSNTLLLVLAVWFQINWVLVVVVIFLTLHLLVSIYLTSWSHKHSIMRSNRWLFVGEYPNTKEEFESSMLRLINFETEDCKTFTYIFINDLNGYVKIHRRSRLLEWNFPDKEECYSEMNNLMNALQTAGLITSLLQITDFQEVVKNG